MKKKYINILIIGSLICVLFEIIMNRELIFNTISFSLNTWVKSIVPSLFPFFVLSDLLINYNIIYYIPARIKKIFQGIFRISESSIVIFFLSMISGFPSNARNTKTMYQKGLITKEEASHILIYTHFSNPLFILGTLAIFFLNNKTYGIIILLSHYLGNVILGIILRRKSPVNSNPMIGRQPSDDKPFGLVFAKSIKSSIDTLLMILGTLTCFLIISTIIINRFDLNSYTSTLIKGILEITMGLKELSMLNIPDIYKVVISAMFLSFGGLSVHMQVITELADTNISLGPFIVGRIYHALISGVIAFVLFQLL